jgi:hypothetical protein
MSGVLFFPFRTFFCFCVSEEKGAPPKAAAACACFFYVSFLGGISEESGF